MTFLMTLACDSSSFLEMWAFPNQYAGMYITIIIATIQIKKKTTHGYIILEFERFIELFVHRNLPRFRQTWDDYIPPVMHSTHGVAFIFLVSQPIKDGHAALVNSLAWALITVGCISGISLLLPGYYYKWIWQRIPESDTATSYYKTKHSHQIRSLDVLHWMLWACTRWVPNRWEWEKLIPPKSHNFHINTSCKVARQWLHVLE